MNEQGMHIEDKASPKAPSTTNDFFLTNHSVALNPNWGNPKLDTFESHVRNHKAYEIRVLYI